MKVIFMGTPVFAVETFHAILEAGHEVVLAVTQPDRPRGRGKAMSFSPVKEAAVERGIPVFQPDRIRKPENVEFLRQYPADIIVVAAFGQILPREILDMPRYGCINVHASLLPRYRGAAPIQWAVINGDKRAGVTIMQMDEGLDTGDMLRQTSVELAADETGGSLFDRLAGEGAALCVQVMEEIQKQTAVRTPQDEAKATHVGMITKEMGDVDWRRPAEELERLIRGLNPWPSAYTYLNRKTFKLWRARVVPDEGQKAAPGTVIRAEGAIAVQTGKGVLELLEVQLEGKKRMSAEAFLRGYHLETGIVLG